ncbi:MAG TPA: ATP-binding cassette domain-containing protein [Gemmatimonadaceae bacterium]|nr:ATP-binding cassette domain-containing protein [Gemmatimonadaceae bacterium]
MVVRGGADRTVSEHVTPRPLALSLRGITKQFGGTVALDSAVFAVRGRTLHALLGENGAGKTTLMRIVFGMLRPDAGVVVVDGAERHFRSSADAITAGIGMVHQHFLLVRAMTVAENVALGNVSSAGRLSGLDPRAAAAHVRQTGEETGLLLDPSARIAELPVGAQQRVELVKALAHKARLLVLDEPTAVLAPAEASEIYRWLREFVDRGGTVVLVTHKLREALEIADDVTVLRRGKTVLSGRRLDFTEEAIVRALLGEPARASRDQLPPSMPSGGAAVLRLDDVSVVDEAGVTRLRGATLEAHAGEIVGVVGVEGSGQHQLLRVLAGRLTATSGRVTRPEVVGFVPEDRLRDALIPEFTLVENAALAGLGSARGRMRWHAMAQRVARLLQSFEIHATGPEALASELSGGNQQKFVIARELFSAGRALVVENPTRGLDIRATERVLRDITNAARTRGAAVVFHSSDLDEVLRLADRVYVCFAGHTGEVRKEPAAVARAMVGAA